MRAGARAIEKARLNQGTIYVLHAMNPHGPEIVYAEAVRVLREQADAILDEREGGGEE